MAVDSAAECVFYHSLDLPLSGPQKGHWDLRGRFDDYVGNVPLSGRSALDVGTASGFLSFEAEKRGANIKRGKRCGVCGAGAKVEGAHAHIFRRRRDK